MVFSKPVPKNLHFSAIESLLKAVGCEVIEGDGSRVRFVKGKDMLALHRPHPGKETKPYQVRDVRVFLEMIGMTKEGV
ncbi:type II toxin-antitoxin system HicA family toxin [Solidesulfovibrio sp.]|uniref:type II toxin-antitoxin system HicA family toxin n=1 Tax=Solidesulfovibrio sp. TaxID=2910990 RepID=UPI00260527E6|nr:type II toxin-antitoxin system HicA family toxin [Solidesulfovibrio sp.]